MSLNNHRMTSSDLQNEWQMAAGVKCTARMVQNRAEHYRAKFEKKTFIGVKQRRARLRFAKDHTDWTVEDWSKVIFSDESNFQLCPTPGYLMFDGVLERPTSHSVSHPLWNLVEDRWWSGDASSRLDLGTFVFVKGAWNKSRIKSRLS